MKCPALNHKKFNTFPKDRVIKFFSLVSCSVARLAKFSPKCKKWRNFEGPGEILKVLAKFPILAKFWRNLKIASIFYIFIY